MRSKASDVGKIEATAHYYNGRYLWVAECVVAGYLFRSSTRLESAHPTEAEAIAAARAKVTEWALEIIVRVRRAKAVINYPRP